MNMDKLTYIDEESSDSVEAKIKKLRQKLKQCQKEKEEYLTQAQRARADLINFRRRQEQTQAEIGNYFQENLLWDLLAILDSLESAAKQASSQIKPIQEQLKKILEKYNIKEIKVLGEKFNPQFHEAVEQVKSDKKEGTIVEEVQKGYMLGERVLRVAKVKVTAKRSS